MNLNLETTLRQIQKYLTKEYPPALEKAYEQTLRLRSQLISAIYELKPHSRKEPVFRTSFPNKQIITLTIPEPLPGMRKLTAAVEEHRVAMLHEAIDREAETGIPFWEKAHVWIETKTVRGTNNFRVWDTSNRAINVILNNLKGIFFWDDDFEHLSFEITAGWDEIGQTKIHICAYVFAVFKIPRGAL